LAARERVAMTAAVRVVGAGLPRTGTTSLRIALERLLGGRCLHMSAIEGHPFDLGDPWGPALAGEAPDWRGALTGFVASVDWPASAFWRELVQVHPDALVLLSTRESGEAWLQSLEATILPHARGSLESDWDNGRDLARLFERFTGTPEWDEPEVLLAAYERHVVAVRNAAPPERLVEWRPGDGWEPLCRALHVPLPDEPFPWVNKRETWG
jgi:hypothetical protein